ncbi:MAG: hypothetical protein AAF539_11355 [Planctomycetota bacterium]
MNRWRIVLGALVFSFAVIAIVRAQELLELPEPRTRLELSASERLWLSERRAQLEEQIRHLERIKATLGRKHPSMPEVESELEALQSQLGAWQLDTSPFETAADDDDSLPNAFSQLSDADLRRLVLQMAIKIDRLETRIGVLERRQRQL